MNKKATLSDFLTQEEIEKCTEIFKAHAATPGDQQKMHQRFLSEVIEPNKAAIDAKLGQENDPRYLAYAIEHVYNMIERGHPGAILADIPGTPSL